MVTSLHLCTAQLKEGKSKFGSLRMTVIALQEQRHQSLSVPAGELKATETRGPQAGKLLGDPESSTANSLGGQLSETQLPAGVKEFSVAAGLLLMGTNTG